MSKPAAPNPPFPPELTKAIRADDGAAITALVEQLGGWILSAERKTGGTPLSMAITWRKGGALRTLLRLGADPNTWNFVTDGTAGAPSDTPLLYALITGYREGVRALLAAGARPVLGRSATTPLHFAALGKDPEVISLLIAHGADVNQRDPGDATALLTACHAGAPHSKVVRALLEHGARADQGPPQPFVLSSSHHEPPLHAACRRGHRAAARLLLEFGANPNRVNLHGHTPLHIAGTRGDATLYRLLLRHGANPNLRDRIGCLPRLAETDPKTLPPGTAYPALSGVASDSPRPPVTPVEAPSRASCPPGLTRAIERRDAPAIERIVARHGPLSLLARRKSDEEDAIGFAITHAALDAIAACARLCPESLERLSPSGLTPLFEAITVHDPRAARQLILLGADINRLDSSGQNALHFACRLGRADVAAALIEHGACPERLDDSDYTPELRAREEGHTAAVELLRSHRRNQALRHGPAIETAPAPPEGPSL